MDKIKIQLLHCGHVLVSPNLPFGDGNLIKASGFFEKESEKIWLPVTAVYIEHPKARILVDIVRKRAISPNGATGEDAQILNFCLMLFKLNQDYL